jgi:hypothetical protein
VATEHHAVDDEDEGLEQRVEDRGEREPPDLAGERIGSQERMSL